MAAVLVPCTRVGTFAFGATGYHGAFCSAREVNTTEALSQVRMRAAGTIRNLWSRLTANTLNGTSTFTSRIAGADGNISISVSAAATGTFEDTTNSDAIAADALVDFRFTAGGTTGSFVVQSYAFLFQADSNTVFPTGSTGFSFNTASASTPFQLIGGAVNLSAESFTRQEVATAATLKNLFVYITSNARTTTSTVVTRINGANGNVTVSIGAGATGVFEDTANSDAISAADEICAFLTTGTGTELIVVGLAKISIETTNGSYPIGCGGSVSYANGTTTYQGLGAGGNVSATETDTSVKALTDVSVSKLWIESNSNATTSASTFDLRKNQTSTALTVSIASGTTGEFTDASNTVSVLSTDELNVRMVNGGGGTLAVVHWTALAVAAGKLLPRLQAEGLFVGGVA